MDIRAKFESMKYEDGEYLITFRSAQPVDKYKLSDKLLDVSIKVHRKRRSLDANALLWVCLSKIAEVLRTDKWQVYLQMLKRYGQFTTVTVRTDAVSTFEKCWREVEEVGTMQDSKGQSFTQLLCYYGSHTYSTKEFTILLDGVISEMKELGLETPTSAEMQRSLEQWEKLNQS